MCCKSALVSPHWHPQQGSLLAASAGRQAAPVGSRIAAIFLTQKTHARTCQFRRWPRKTRAANVSPMSSNNALSIKANGETAMQTILSALVALLVIASVAGVAHALDAKSFYEEIDRTHY
jgi:hypothetical protein